MIPLFKNNYMQHSGSGDTFNVEFDTLPATFNNYYEESKLAAEEIYSLKQGNLHILYSGGQDSEYVLKLFLHLGMEITPVIIKLNPGYNDFDTKYAFDFCQTHNITPKVIDIDFDYFVKSGQLLDIAIQTKSSVYHRSATAHAASLLDGTVLVGEAEPHIYLNQETSVWEFNVYEAEYAVSNYFKIKGIYGVPFFSGWTAGMALSYLLDPRMQELANNKHPGRLGSSSSKNIIYNRQSPFLLDNRQKYTGYEQIEKSEIFLHEDFATLAELGKSYNGVYSVGYFEFLKDYIPQ